MVLGYIDLGGGFTIFSFVAIVVSFLIGLFGLLVLNFRKVFNFIKKHRRLVIICLLLIFGIAWFIKETMSSNDKTHFGKKIIKEVYFK